MFAKILRSISLLIGLIFSHVSVAMLVPADLLIHGSVEFDTGSSFIDGGATHSTTMDSVIGGAAGPMTTVTGLTPVGPNPVGGMFTHLGDSVSTSVELFGDADDAGEVFFDYGIDLENTSGSSFFDVFFEIEVSNSVDADIDAFADSLIALFDASAIEIFFSDLLSDTLFGDEKNGAVLGTSGDLVTDISTFGFGFTLAPGEILTFGSHVAGKGEGFAGGAFSLLSDSSITLVDAHAVIVPEPSGFMLFLSSLLILRVSLKKKNTSLLLSSLLRRDNS
ncbi:hypothetical protein MHO82_23425 [Vibrio sp. Of7-15]|uniref:hypothetical protein n=1 Tax=Vibrio sp. Of7-15 TaxID=2724879 RepID=UPI001EF3706A|nr:hypothetical protein [Vibrio sp. Of7-15]MCG7499823.1 hypothetical protein [Vibrio sp. Of7-15]